MGGPNRWLRRQRIQALGLNILFFPLPLILCLLSFFVAFIGEASLPLTPLKRVYYEVSVLARLLFG